MTLWRHICSLPNPGILGTPHELFYPDTPEGHARAEEFAQRENRPGRGVYDCIGKLKDGARSRNKETVAELDHIIADIDLKNIAEPSDHVLQTLRGLVLPPSEVRDSGFGLHAIWYLKEPANDDSLEQAEDLMKRVAALLAADPAPTHRAALLRRPGTDNTKNGAPRKVCVIDSKAAAYDITELGDMIDLYDGRPLLTRKQKAKANGRDPESEGGTYEPAESEDSSTHEPVDVGARLAAMQFEGPGDTSVHNTQLAVTASMTAIIVIDAEGLDVRVTPNPERLHAIAPRLMSDTLDELKKSLKALDVSGLPLAERLAQLRRLPGVVISEPGTLYAENAKELRSHVDSLVARLLTSVRAPAPISVPKATALVQELSKTFRKEKLLGRGDDLSKHKVVRNVAVSSDGSLRADFVAKNRFLYVTETVDLRTSGQLTTGRLKDIAVAAVTLDEAKRTFGRGTRRYFVYAGSASAEKQARGYLRAAEYHADEVFNFLSRTDRAAYLDYIFAALRGDLAGVARLGAPVGKNVRPRASARR
jgi:hypothetical protein